MVLKKAVSQKKSLSNEGNRLLRFGHFRLSSITNSMNDAVLLAGPDGTISDWNKSAEKIFCCPKHEILGNPLWQLAPKNSQNKIKKIIENAGAHLVDHEMERVGSKGEIIHLSFNMEPMFDARGNRIGIVALARDITGKKRSGDEQNRFRIFLDNINDACFEFDLHGRCIFCNEAVHRQLGYSREDFMKLTHHERYVTTEEADKVFRIYNNVFKTGNPETLFESEMRCRDGSTVTIEMMVSPILNDQDIVIGFRGVGRDVTKSRKVQEALRQSEARYRNLFEHNNAVMVLMDPDTARIVDVNAAACAYYGYPKEALMGKPVTLINTLSDEEMQVELNMAGLEHRNHFYFKHRLACGDVRPVEVFTGPVEIDGRRLIYSIVHDITERREAEDALRHSETKYRTIIENMQDAYFECGLDGTFTFANNTACTTLGYTLAELRTLDYRKLTTPESVDKIRQVYEQTLETGIPSTLVDYEIVCRNGTIRIHQLHVGLMRDAAGKPIGFRTVSRDVTERRQAEEELRRSEEKYRSILEKMTEGYFESDTHGRILFVNDAACDMMGYSREQLYRMDYRKFITPETKKKMDEAYRKVFQTGLPSTLGDYEIVRADGRIRIHQLSIGLMKDASGKKIGFRAVARDVTEGKQAEEALRLSEERIRVLFDNIPVPTVVWKSEKDKLILAEYNDAALQYTNGKIIEYIGKTVEECYPHAPHIAIDMHQCFTSHTNIEKGFWFKYDETAENKYVTIKYAFAPPNNVIMHINDITAQKRAEEHLKHISIHDALTGLYNRFYSDAEIARIGASRIRPVSFIMIDLNNLKSINDRLGHAAGDEYIRKAASLLKETFRPADMIARVGGDEFIAMLPTVDEDTCQQMLDRLHDNLARYNRDADQPISFSAGFSTANAGDNIEALIAEADRRMYREKARMKSAQKMTDEE